MRTPRRRLLALATVAGVVAGLATPAGAQAAGWDLNGSGAGVVGAHASGTVVKEADGWVRITATLKDTDPNDGKQARVKLTFLPDGRQGAQKVITTSSTETYSHRYGDLNSIRAIECVVRAGSEHCGANEVTIWSR
jgi:hypothetical protein